jgi:ferrochelatase
VAGFRRRLIESVTVAEHTKLAVVVFNLGGPDGLDSVRPFLFNLFNDPAIIGAPAPVRWLLAQWISWKRAPVARDIYRRIGGRSPLVDLTGAQTAALEALLQEDGETRVFIAMRYWHPVSDETATAVKAFDPDEIVLLPLYPQYSTTTSQSSLTDWQRAAAAVGLAKPTRAICCAPDEDGFIRAQAKLVGAAVGEAGNAGKPRILFSAHGLPKRIIERGDPYAWQVARTAEAIVAALDSPDLDWVICYQSRVGPLEWIGPDIRDELKRAAADRVPVVVTPIAFVSEHSETLVELDIEYAQVARDLGISAYVRVPAVGTEPDYIAGLAHLVRESLRGGKAVCSSRGGRRCPREFSGCPMDNGGT